LLVGQFDSFVNDKLEYNSFASLSYEDPDNYVWEGLDHPITNPSNSSPILWSVNKLNSTDFIITGSDGGADENLPGSWGTVEYTNSKITVKTEHNADVILNYGELQKFVSVPEGDNNFVWNLN
jgi:hypothetical protein